MISDFLLLYSNQTEVIALSHKNLTSSQMLILDGNILSQSDTEKK